MTRIESIKARLAAATSDMKELLDNGVWRYSVIEFLKAAPQDLRDLLLCYDALRDVVVSNWAHRCEDGVGGCPAVSQLELDTAKEILAKLDSPVGDEGAER